MMQEAGYEALILAGNAEAMQRGYIRYVADWRLWGGKGFIVLPLAGELTLVLGAGSQSYWSKIVDWIPVVRAASDMAAGWSTLSKVWGWRKPHWGRWA